MTTSNIAAHGSAPASLSVGQGSGCGGGGAFGAGIQEAIMQENLVLLPQYIHCKWILR